MDGLYCAYKLWTYIWLFWLCSSIFYSIDFWWRPSNNASSRFLALAKITFKRPSLASKRDEYIHSGPYVTITRNSLPYNTSEYENFDLIEALTKSQFQLFNFNYWDPIKFSSNYGLSMNIYQDSILKSTIQLCEAMTQGLDADKSSWLRCIQPAVGTFRWRIVQVVSNISKYYETFPFEEEIFPLTYAYEYPVIAINSVAKTTLDLQKATLNPNGDVEERSTSVLPQSIGKGTACILGSPTAHSILTMLIYPHITHIRVFSTQFDEETIEAMEEFDEESMDWLNDFHENSEGIASGNVYWNYYYAKEASDFFQKEVEYLGYKSLIYALLTFRKKQVQFSTVNNHDTDGIEQNSDVIE